ncbi:MAG: hypothetical protein ACLUW6_00320 [Coriobacteriaceae bacterium]
MVIIEDEDKRKGIDVCEGAIGWLTKASNGMEIFHLYHAFAKESGLAFHPFAQMGAVYVRDPSGLDRFLDLESLPGDSKGEDVRASACRLLLGSEIPSLRCVRRKYPIRNKLGKSRLR